MTTTKSALLKCMVILFLTTAASLSFGEEDQSAKDVDKTIKDKEEQKLQSEIDTLLETIEQAEDTREKAAAARQLVKKGKAAIPHLVELYPSKNTEMKGWLAQIFLRLKTPEDTKDVLFEDFEKEGLGAYPDVIRALGKMKDERATPLMLKCLKTANAEQKSALYHALGEVTDYRTVQALREGIGSDEKVIWTNCVNGLRKLQARALKEIEKKKQERQSHKEEQKSLDAVQKALVDGLKRCKGKKDRERFLIEVLGKSRDEKFSSTVANFLNDDNVSLRIVAMNALAELKDTFYATDICALLDDESEIVRRKVPRALAKLGDLSVVPNLIEVLYSEDPLLKKESLLALRKLSGQKFAMNPNLWMDWWKRYQTSPEIE